MTLLFVRVKKSYDRFSFRLAMCHQKPKRKVLKFQLFSKKRHYTQNIKNILHILHTMPNTYISTGYTSKMGILA